MPVMNSDFVWIKGQSVFSCLQKTFCMKDQLASGLSG